MDKITERIALHEKGKMRVQIRLNRTLTEENGYSYRLIKDGQDILLIDSAIFHCPCYTLEEEVVISGKKYKNSFITCDAKELKVTIEPKTENLIAHIK